MNGKKIVYYKIFFEKIYLMNFYNLKINILILKKIIKNLASIKKGCYYG